MILWGAITPTWRLTRLIALASSSLAITNFLVNIPTWRIKAWTTCYNIVMTLRIRIPSSLIDFLKDGFLQIVSGFPIQKLLTRSGAPALQILRPRDCTSPEATSGCRGHICKSISWLICFRDGAAFARDGEAGSSPPRSSKEGDQKTATTYNDKSKKARMAHQRR